MRQVAQLSQSTGERDINGAAEVCLLFAPLTCLTTAKKIYPRRDKKKKKN
jgi:hypothetical protein